MVTENCFPQTGFVEKDFSQGWERSRRHSRRPVDSILEAVLTVSPKRQYRGMVRPTTPATQGPENQTCMGNPGARQKFQGPPPMPPHHTLCVLS